ncbi:hypothetical protein EB796_022514 [Bugula neritina]|uniref:Uncharacterized protein n=1 Tax=Bugula neritina TaxID=10212 RepID=A0A7J7J0K9_BUGNE|nr:hypothetical protein EB796_022514 [Bugula neritina]
MNLLHSAIASGSLSVVKYVYSKTKNTIHVGTTATGATVLHIATGLGFEDILHFLLTRISIYSLINYADINGWTAAHLAAMRNQPACLAILIGFNADVFAIRDKDSKSVYQILREKNTAEMKLTFPYIFSQLEAEDEPQRQSRYQSRYEKKKEKQNSTLSTTEDKKRTTSKKNGKHVVGRTLSDVINKETDSTKSNPLVKTDPTSLKKRRDHLPVVLDYTNLQEADDAITIYFHNGELNTVKVKTFVRQDDFPSKETQPENVLFQSEILKKPAEDGKTMTTTIEVHQELEVDNSKQASKQESVDSLSNVALQSEILQEPVEDDKNTMTTTIEVHQELEVDNSEQASKQESVDSISNSLAGFDLPDDTSASYESVNGDNPTPGSLRTESSTRASFSTQEILTEVQLQHEIENSSSSQLLPANFTNNKEDSSVIPKVENLLVVEPQLSAEQDGVSNISSHKETKSEDSLRSSPSLPQFSPPIASQSSLPDIIDLLDQKLEFPTHLDNDQVSSVPPELTLDKNTEGAENMQVMFDATEKIPQSPDTMEKEYLKFAENELKTDEEKHGNAADLDDRIPEIPNSDNGNAVSSEGLFSAGMCAYLV